MAGHDDLFVASAHDFIALLREHIRIEDEYFFRLVARVLPPEEDRALAARMTAMEAQHAQQEWASRQAALLQHCADVAARWRRAPGPCVRTTRRQSPMPDAPASRAAGQPCESGRRG